ncbi:hypothetical protein VTK56DRAFT_9015 [Thermocarpiscus australiensis]
MGNESSRPEMPDGQGRARSLSPLPRDAQFAIDGFPTPPATMPASVTTEVLRLRGRYSGSPEPLRIARDARSRSPSPETLPPRSRSASPLQRPINASQPARLVVEIPRAVFHGYATQPELSELKQSRSAKRQSSEVKGKSKQRDVGRENGHRAARQVIDRDAALYGMPSSKRKHKRSRRSMAPEPPDILGDVVPTDAGSAATPVYETDDSPTKKSKGKGKEVIRPPDVVWDEEPTNAESAALPADDTDDRPSKKNKGKGKEVVRPVVDHSLFDFSQEPPPSAQPLAKRDRRDSNSRARKKRKNTPPSDDGPNGEGTVGPDDEPVGRFDQTLLQRSDRQSPGDNIKVEREEDAVLGTTQLQRGEGSQHSQYDSGYAEPDGQVQSELVSDPDAGMDLDMTDGMPHFGNGFQPGTGGVGDHDDDDNTSAASGPHEGIGAGHDAASRADDNMARVSSFTGRAVAGSRSATKRPAQSRNKRSDKDVDHGDGDGGDSDNQSEGQHIPEEHGDFETAATPPASSAKSPGSRPSTKRKAKQPFIPRRENEEAATAFAELPLDDVAVPPKAKRPVRAPTSVPAEAGPSNAAQVRSNQKRSKKKPAVTDTATEESDDQVRPVKSQYRSGALSKTEQDQITRAVERFRADEGLTQQEVNLLIHDNPQKSDQTNCRQLWASIQEACPSRPRRKLIMWCRQRFHNFVGRATWTKEQDDELVRLVELHGKKWTYIGGLINRYPSDVRDRWRNYLVCRDHVKTDTWSEGEEERFRDLVESSIEKIQKELGSKAADKSPGELINWLQISEAMGYTRSRLQCMEKWKRMRAAEPIAPTILPPGSSWRLRKARRDLRKMTTQDKYTLMCAVRDSGVGKDTKISWKQIVHKTFHGKYERQALVVAWGRLRQAVPDWEWKTTRDCAGYLCEMYEREGNFGTAEHDEAEESDDELEEAEASRKDRKGKGKAKEVVPQSSAEGPIPGPRGRRSKKDTVAPAATAGGSKSESKARRSKPIKSQAVVQDDETTEEDDAMDEVPSAKKSRPAEREGSPELGAKLSQTSPSVDARAARAKSLEKQRRAGEQTSSKGKERDMGQPATQETDAKGSKRARRDSLSNDKASGPKPKKRRKNSQSSSADRPELNGGEASDDGGGDDERSKIPRKALSVISSDMDDMEDIPARLPRSSQVAY